MSTRLAFYYEDGRRISRNDGPPLYWWNAARNIFGKENVAHSIPNGNYPDGQDRFDYHIWVDWGEDALMPILDYTPKTPPRPNIYVCSDAHIGYDYRLSRAREFDYVFCNQLRCCEEFVRDGILKEKVFWLPHAVEPKAYPAKNIIKRYDVCFVGNINGTKRIDFLDRMFKEFPNFFFGKRLFEEAAEVFSSSRVVLNIAIGDDINMRVFEALATKSLLLTEWLPTMEGIFQDGVHLVTFKTHDEAVEKARYYIEHEEEAMAIAERGYQEVIAKHTYTHRLTAAIEMVNKSRLVPTCAA